MSFCSSFCFSNYNFQSGFVSITSCLLFVGQVRVWWPAAYNHKFRKTPRTTMTEVTERCGMARPWCLKTGTRWGRRLLAQGRPFVGARAAAPSLPYAAGAAPELLTVIICSPWIANGIQPVSNARNVNCPSTRNSPASPETATSTARRTTIGTTTSDHTFYI